MTKTPVKFQKNWYITVGGVAPTRYPLSIQFVIDNARKMAKFNLQKKVTKNNLRIKSKPRAYLQTLTKTPVKFRKNLYKTVGVAQTRYPLTIYFVTDNARKMASEFNLLKKSDKK